MSDSDFPRGIEWIRSVLPHRYPFLLVDRVLEMEEGKSIRALKNVSGNEEFFIGHFPDRPVMPGVLLVEAIAQAAGILLIHDREGRENELMYLAGVEQARFRRPVVPGDQVILEAEILKVRRNFSRIGGRAVVDGKVAVEAVVSCAMVSR